MFFRAVTDGAGVTQVWTLVLHLHPHQQQWGVPSGDLIMEERGPVPERWYLLVELVAVVIVRMDIVSRLFKPVDESILSKGESARQDASFSPNTDCRFCEETPSTFRLIVCVGSHSSRSELCKVQVIVTQREIWCALWNMSASRFYKIPVEVFLGSLSFAVLFLSPLSVLVVDKSAFLFLKLCFSSGE